MRIFLQVLIFLTSTGASACPDFSGKYAIERDMQGSKKIIELAQTSCEELNITTTYIYNSGAEPSPYRRTILIGSAWHNNILRINTPRSLEEWVHTENGLNIVYSNFNTGSWSDTYTEEFSSVK